MESQQKTTTQLLPEFEQSLTELGRSPSTILAYKADLEQLVDYLGKNNIQFISDVKQDNLVNFRDYLSAQNYTPKSVSRKLNAIKTFFRWLKDKQYITNDVSKDVSHPETESTDPKFLTPMEYRALRDVARTDIRIAAIVELILQTGMRISEVANLKLKNVKKDHLIVEPHATQPQRTVPLNEAAQLALKDYLRERPQADSDYLFISKNGKQLAVRNIRASIDRYMEKAEIPRYSVNDLRTTFIIENLRRGVDLVTISQVSGHKRLSTTERYLDLAGVKETGKKQELEQL